LEDVVSSLSTALALEPREHLALVGGGGKTSLMFALAEELCKKKRRVITSTTTKIWQHEARRSSHIAFTQAGTSWRDELKEGLKRHAHVFLAHSLLDTGKLKGISPSLADELFLEGEMDYLLLEADGSAGLPVKVPAAHEPVIPPTVTTVVGMLGLEAIGKKSGPEVVFRLNLFRKLMGINPEQRLTPPILAKIFLSPEGVFKGTPFTAKKVVFLNKLDMLAEKKEAKDLAHMIIGKGRKQIHRVVMGSIKKGVYLITGGEQ